MQASSINMGGKLLLFVNVMIIYIKNKELIGKLLELMSLASVSDKNSIYYISLYFCYRNIQKLKLYKDNIYSATKKIKYLGKIL